MSSKRPLSRRGLLTGAVAAATLPAVSAEEKPTLKGNIKHSIVYWCFNAAGDKWNAEKMCQVAKQVGCVSVELGPPATWPTLKKYGLSCAIASSGTKKTGFIYGLNNPAHQADVIAQTKATMDQCAEAGVERVIAFVGYRWVKPEDSKSGEISRDDAFRNCVAGLKELAGYGEKKGVTVCLEHLNTRDDSHPMKGHPGYQGDDLDFCAEILRKVGSPRSKLLFDIYHVQIMHGDLLRRLEQVKDILGHIHTAGNPGRGELDDKQEIAYPAVMRKLVEMKYTGYVGHEFIPTRDPLAGLTEAVRVCDL